MSQIQHWTWSDWVVNVPLFLFSAFFLWFGLWLTWCAIAKEDYGDEYRPLGEIIVRIVTLAVLFIIMTCVVIGFEGCQKALLR